MGNGHFQWRARLALLGGIVLAGCVPQETLDCGTLEGAFDRVAEEGALLAAAADSLEAQLNAACEALPLVARLPEAFYSPPDTAQAQALDSLVRRQELLDRQLHGILAATTAGLFGSRPPARFDELRAQLESSVPAGQDMDPMAALAAHVSGFESAKVLLGGWLSEVDSPQAAALARLQVALLDSLHAALRASFVRTLPAAGAPLSPSLDTLGAEIRHLAARHAVQAASHRAFMQGIAGSAIPLAGTAESSRTRELAWQFGQAAGLLREVILALQASAQYYADAGTGASRLRLEDAIGRLADAAGTLEHRSADLARAMGRPDAGATDSVRLAVEAIERELLRQERSLAGLQDALASIAPAERDQRPVQLIGEAAAVYGDVHADTRALAEALTAQLGSELQNYGAKIFATILLILVGFGLIRAAMWLLDTIAERSASRRLFYKRLIPIVRLVVWSVLLYVVLAYVFQLDQRSLFAAAAAIGVAIGFAAQNILKNVFGGIIIIFDQPFQVGDKIRVGGTYGEVVSIGLRATRIVTPDDNEVTVPNAQVIDTQVANANTGSLDCQVVVELFIPGWSDTAKAKAIAYSAAANSKYVFLGKPIVVNVQDVFKETFLTRLAVKAYVLDTRYEFAFASDVTETAKAEFKRQGYFAQLEKGGIAWKAP